jgi:hypothetical protein
MRTTSLLSLCLLGACYTFSQQNELPSTGNVGIGTTDPSARLDVRGSVKIDSTLWVKDSVVISRDARVKQQFTVDGKTILKDDAVMHENLSVKGRTELAGDLQLTVLKDPTLLESEVLLLDTAGNVVRGGELKSLVYADVSVPEVVCRDANGGYTTPAAPTWANGPGKIYTTRACVPDVKVGIGTSEPLSKLHIQLNDPVLNTHAIIVETANGHRLLQLDENGLLKARKIRVDSDTWADDVFEEGYVLLSPEALQQYILLNHHLPAIPSECEVLESGIDLAGMDQLLLRKVEELTVYLLQEHERNAALELRLQQIERQLNELCKP